MEFAPNEGNGSTISLSLRPFDGLGMPKDAKTSHRQPDFAPISHDFITMSAP